MADPTVREIAITLPSDIGGDVSVLRLAIVDDGKIAGGKRAITRAYRDANATDPGRIRRVEWEVWGPVGASIESTAGGLGVDFVRNLETRWERRLISAGEQTSVDLTPFDPPGTGDGTFGSFNFGDVATPFGSPIAGTDVVVFAEQNDYLLALRGRLLTQIDMSTDPWSVVSTTILDAAARDADHWRSTVKIALGPSAVMQRVTGASGSGVTLEDVTATSPAESVYASAIKRGSDRAWYINANQSQTSFNFAGYALDDFVNLASPFQVGDPDIGTTGIGPFGPFTLFGTEDGVFSFTDQGKPIPLSRALTQVHSSLNGYQFADPGWGWNYYTAVTGLRANAGGVDNPVGIGERMRGFTGHDGVAHALWQMRGEMPVIYHTVAGAIYGYRGTFGPETAGTGQPMLWPWFYSASADSHAIYTSRVNAPSHGMWLIRADGTNMTYQLISADGRDDLFPSYTYSTSGGTAYLTTLDRDPSLLKVLRLARLRTRNMVSGDSWTVGFAFDSDPTDSAGATYVSLDAVTTNGGRTLVPDNGTVTGQANPSPTASIAGRTIKPRIVQVAGGADSDENPPEIDGTLEIEYDERPEQIEEIELAVNLTATDLSNNYVWDTLLALLDQQTDGPVRIQLPDDMPAGVTGGSGGGQKYAMVAGVSARQDISDNSIEALTLRLNVWPQAAALA